MTNGDLKSAMLPTVFESALNADALFDWLNKCDARVEKQILIQLQIRTTTYSKYKQICITNIGVAWGLEKDK